MSKILNLENISVSYGNIKALKGIDLFVDEGEIVSLIGANGAGKSTLLKAILGLEPLQKGQISYRDQILAQAKDNSQKTVKTPTHLIVEQGISLVPEGRGIFTDMTVQENLDMGGFLCTDKIKIEEKKDQNYELFPILGDRRKQKAGSLSGGEQQMLSIARAIMNSPRLLLLDEPGLGLAPLIVKNIFNIIQKVNREEGVTILLVEQNAKMALNSSHRGYVMETGNIVLNDESKVLLNDPKVKAAYLGE